MPHNSKKKCLPGVYLIPARDGTIPACRFCRYDSGGMPEHVDLGPLRNLTGLTSLRLAPGLRLKDGNTTFLSELTRLTSLDLYGERIEESETEAFASALRGLTQLTSLRMRYFLSEASVAPALCGLVGLTYLDLTGTQKGDVTAWVRPLGRLTRLTHLDLSAIELLRGDKARQTRLPLLRRFAAALGMLPELTILRLGNNCIGDDGAFVLAPVVGKLSRLRELELRGNDISDRGAIALFKELKTLSALHTVRIGFCGCIERLREEMNTGRAFCLFCLVE